MTRPPIRKPPSIGQDRLSSYRSLSRISLILVIQWGMLSSSSEKSFLEAVSGRDLVGLPGGWVSSMRILLTGASGQLGAYLIESLTRSGEVELIAWSGRSTGERAGVPFRSVDLADLRSIGRELDRADPDALIHAAAISAAGDCFRDPGLANRVNREATDQIAAWCHRKGRRMVFTSTDLVFDGSRAWNSEEDPAQPILTYGQTKREAESAVLALPEGLVARMSLMYGPSRMGQAAYLDRSLESLRQGEPQRFFEDEFRTPLDLASAAEILSRLVISDANGLIHVAGLERVSRFDLMRRLAVALGLDSSLVLPNRQADVSTPEPRPADASLATHRLASLLPDFTRPTIEEAASQFVEWSS